jgi:hypothetical protein
MNIESTVEDSDRVSRRGSLRAGRAHGTPQALVLVRLLGDRIESGPQHAEFSSSI